MLHSRNNHLFWTKKTKKKNIEKLFSVAFCVFLQTDLVKIYLNALNAHWSNIKDVECLGLNGFEKILKHTQSRRGKKREKKTNSIDPSLDIVIFLKIVCVSKEIKGTHGILKTENVYRAVGLGITWKKKKSFFSHQNECCCCVHCICFVSFSLRHFGHICFYSHILYSTETDDRIDVR